MNLDKYNDNITILNLYTINLNYIPDLRRF